MDSAAACRVEPPPLPAILEARRQRRLAAVLGLMGLVVFLVAAGLDPYDESGRPRRHGTHRQLGLPACALKAVTGFGCPSCGMTTSFSLLAHGDVAAAWQTNWAGCVIAAMAALGTVWFLAAAAGLTLGRLTVDKVVQAMVLTGMSVAVVRWLAIIGFALIGPECPN